jgi:hypothetical protein
MPYLLQGIGLEGGDPRSYEIKLVKIREKDV